MRTKNIVAGITAMAAAFVISAPQAHANSILELISGGSTVSINGVAGVASYNGSVGSWNINVTTGLAIPSAPANTIDLDSVDETLTGTPQTLTILWSGDGYSGTYGYAMGGGGSLTGGITDTFSSYYGALLSTTTPLTASDAVSSPSFTISGSGAIVTGSYAITEEVVISGATAINSLTSFDFDVTALPDGGMTIALLGGAMTAMALIRSKVGKLK